VRPLDPATFVFVTIVRAITAALSIVGPAWRAAASIRPWRCATPDSLRPRATRANLSPPRLV
jgi:hypothetical protein